MTCFTGILTHKADECPTCLKAALCKMTDERNAALQGVQGIHAGMGESGAPWHERPEAERQRLIEDLMEVVRRPAPPPVAPELAALCSGCNHPHRKHYTSGCVAPIPGTGKGMGGGLQQECECTGYVATPPVREAKVNCSECFGRGCQSDGVSHCYSCNGTGEAKADEPRAQLMDRLGVNEASVAEYLGPLADAASFARDVDALRARLESLKAVAVGLASDLGWAVDDSSALAAYAAWLEEESK